MRCMASLHPKALRFAASVAKKLMIAEKIKAKLMSHDFARIAFAVDNASCRTPSHLHVHNSEFVMEHLE